MSLFAPFGQEASQATGEVPVATGLASQGDSQGTPGQPQGATPRAERRQPAQTVLGGGTRQGRDSGAAVAYPRHTLFPRYEDALVPLGSMNSLSMGTMPLEVSSQGGAPPVWPAQPGQARGGPRGGATPATAPAQNANTAGARQGWQGRSELNAMALEGQGSADITLGSAGGSFEMPLADEGMEAPGVPAYSQVGAGQPRLQTWRSEAVDSLAQLPERMSLNESGTWEQAVGEAEDPVLEAMRQRNFVAAPRDPRGAPGDRGLGARADEGRAGPGAGTNAGTGVLLPPSQGSRTPGAPGLPVALPQHRSARLAEPRSQLTLDRHPSAASTDIIAQLSDDRRAAQDPTGVLPDTPGIPEPRWDRGPEQQAQQRAAPLVGAAGAASRQEQIGAAPGGPREGAAGMGMKIERAGAGWGGDVPLGAGSGAPMSEGGSAPFTPGLSKGRAPQAGGAGAVSQWYQRYPSLADAQGKSRDRGRSTGAQGSSGDVPAGGQGREPVAQQGSSGGEQEARGEGSQSEGGNSSSSSHAGQHVGLAPPLPTIVGSGPRQVLVHFGSAVGGGGALRSASAVSLRTGGGNRGLPLAGTLSNTRVADRRRARLGSVEDEDEADNYAVVPCAGDEAQGSRGNFVSSRSERGSAGTQPGNQLALTSTAEGIASLRAGNCSLGNPQSRNALVLSATTGSGPSHPPHLAGAGQTGSGARVSVLGRGDNAGPTQGGTHARSDVLSLPGTRGPATSGPAKPTAYTGTGAAANIWLSRWLRPAPGGAQPPPPPARLSGQASGAPTARASPAPIALPTGGPGAGGPAGQSRAGVTMDSAGRPRHTAHVPALPPPNSDPAPEGEPQAQGFPAMGSTGVGPFRFGAGAAGAQKKGQGPKRTPLAAPQAQGVGLGDTGAASALVAGWRIEGMPALAPTMEGGMVFGSMRSGEQLRPLGPSSGAGKQGTGSRHRPRMARQGHAGGSNGSGHSGNMLMPTGADAPGHASATMWQPHGMPDRREGGEEMPQREIPGDAEGDADKLVPGVSHPGVHGAPAEGQKALNPTGHEQELRLQGLDVSGYQQAQRYQGLSQGRYQGWSQSGYQEEQRPQGLDHSRYHQGGDKEELAHQGQDQSGFQEAGYQEERRHGSSHPSPGTDPGPGAGMGEPGWGDPSVQGFGGFGNGGGMSEAGLALFDPGAAGPSRNVKGTPGVHQRRGQGRLRGATAGAGGQASRPVEDLQREAQRDFQRDPVSGPGFGADHRLMHMSLGSGESHEDAQSQGQMQEQTQGEPQGHLQGPFQAHVQGQFMGRFQGQPRGQTQGLSYTGQEPSSQRRSPGTPGEAAGPGHGDELPRPVGKGEEQAPVFRFGAFGGFTAGRGPQNGARLAGKPYAQLQTGVEAMDTGTPGDLAEKVGATFQRKGGPFSLPDPSPSTLLSGVPRHGPQGTATPRQETATGGGFGAWRDRMLARDA